MEIYVHTCVYKCICIYVAFLNIQAPLGGVEARPCHNSSRPGLAWSGLAVGLVDGQAAPGDPM